MAIPSLTTSTSLVLPQKSLSVSGQPQVKMKAIIKDNLKAGGTMVKEVNAVLTPKGIQVNIIR